MNDSKYSVEYFANARTALKISLQKMNVQEGSFILVPDTTCDVLTHPLIQLNLNIIFYPLDKKLAPDWQTLEALVTSTHCYAVVMIHYFGQPQDLEKFVSFCSRHNLLLIEDNAHGRGGCYNNKLLGTFGDIGISSPRKFLAILSGGELYQNTHVSHNVTTDLVSFPILRFKTLAKTIISQFKFIRNFVLCLANRKKEWSNPYLYQEQIQPDYQIDPYSRSKVISTNWANIAKQRRNNWMAWEKFARSKGLQPVFPEVFSESCPWAFPVYTADIKERNWWLEWGANNNVALFPWPSLPENIVNRNGDAFGRWKRMVCFPLDLNPEELAICNN